MLENIKIMNMKRVLFIVAAAAMTLTSCVSLSEMEALQAKYDQTSKKYNLTQQELLEMKEENAELSRVNQSLSSEMTDMALAKASAEARADSLNRRLEQMHHHYSRPAPKSSTTRSASCRPKRRSSPSSRRTSCCSAAS